MRTQVSCVLCAALSITMAHAGCRVIGGLDGLEFDLPDAGPTGSGATGGGGVDGSPGTDAGGAAGCAPIGDVCGDPVPSGWIGPVAFYEGARGTEPSCPSAYPTLVAKGTAGVDAAPATCSACTCGSWTVNCAQAVLDLAPTCAGGPITQTTLEPATCTPILAGSDGFILHPPTADVSCMPSGGVPSLPPLGWTIGGIACGAAEQPIACADGSRCAPPPPAPFAPKWCIVSMAAAACPSGFPERHIWSTASDGRGCVPCTCTGDGSATCTAEVVLHDDGNCGHQVGKVTSDNQCVQKGKVASLLLTTTPSGTPSCQPGGGTPTGEVSTTPAVSVCCAP